jgi:TolA-binding protein
MKDNDTDSTTDVHHAEDLIALERRRSLTEHERRRLDMCLGSSDSLRVMRQLHADFESHGGQYEPEDAITESCVAAAKQRFAQSKPRGKRTRIPPRGALIGASVLMLTMVASAAAVRWAQWAHRGQAGSRYAEPMPTTKASPLTSVLNARRDAATMQPAAEANVAGTNRAMEEASSAGVSSVAGNSPAPPPNHEAERSRSPSSAARATKTAVELFSSANAARRSGETRKAVELYSRLLAQFPLSEEALVSNVLLARLHLSQGAAAEAVREFDAYLERAPRGSLAEEALQGQAQSLSRLGRTQEAKATWRRLLRTFPNSVYAPSAREHVAEDAQ